MKASTITNTNVKHIIYSVTETINRGNVLNIILSAYNRKINNNHDDVAADGGMLTAQEEE